MFQTSCQVLDLQIKNYHHTMQSIPAEQLLKLTKLFSLSKKMKSKLSTKLNEIHRSQFFKLLLQEWSYDLTPAHTSSDTYVATHLIVLNSTHAHASFSIKRPSIPATTTATTPISFRTSNVFTRRVATLQPTQPHINQRRLYIRALLISRNPKLCQSLGNCGRIQIHMATISNATTMHNHN